jgi:hypothetical protein
VKLVDKDREIRSLQREQSTLREDNSKLKLDVYRLESERGDVDRHSRIRDSLGNTIRSSYEQDIAEGSGHKAGSESGNWEVLKLQSETFKKNLDDASASSQYLKEKVKSLQRDFVDILPEKKYKK